MRHWFERSSVRAKIWLLVLSMLLLSGVVLGWLLFADLEDARADADDLVTRISADTAGKVTRYLSRTEAIMARLAQRPMVKALRAHQCDPMIGEYAQLHEEYAALAVLDLQGHLVCADLTKPFPQVNERLLTLLGDGIRSAKFNASDAYPWDASGRWVTLLTYPVRDDEGKIKGVMALPIDLLTLNARLVVELPQAAWFAVFDRHQAALLRSPNAGLSIGQRKSDRQTTGRDLREGISTMTDHSGALNLVAYQTLPTNGWRVGAGQNEADIFAGFHERVARIIALGLVGLTLIVWMARRVTVAVIKPMASLADVAERVANGDTTARLSLEGPAEFNAVARQFNTMLDTRELSAARLRGVFQSASDAILIMDDQRKIVMANEAAAAMFRWPVADLIGVEPERLMPQRFRDRHQQDVQAFDDAQSVPRKMGRSRYVTGIRSDGEEFQADAAVSRLKVAGQYMYTVILRDVTERRLAEAQLQTTKATLDAALAGMSDAFCISDINGKLLEFNHAFALFHRFNNKDECQRTLVEYQALFDVLMPNGKLVPVDQWPISRALRGEAANSIEYGLRRKDTGAYLVGSYSYAPIRNSDGDITGSVISVRDVTERRQMEDALIEREAQLRTLLMRLPDAVVVNCGDRITFVNDAAQRLLCASAAQLLGRTVSDVLPSLTRGTENARLALLEADSWVKHPMEEVIVRGDGSKRIVETTVSLIELNGETAVLSIMRDITSLKQTQRNLQEAHADLQRLLDARERVQEEERQRIAMELHDELQQTLAAISMDVSAAGRYLRSAPDRADALLGKVSKAAMAAIESARHIVNDLRPQMLEDLGLMPALEQMANRFGQRVGVACFVDASDDDIACVALTSPAMTLCLYRVAQEALNNIEKHAKASVVHILLSRTDSGDLMLRISDNGKGMNAAHRHRPGSFGLLGMRERVRAVGGTLCIGSEVGIGTIIEVHMPGTRISPSRQGKVLEMAMGAEHAQFGGAQADHAEAFAQGSQTEDIETADPMLQSVIDALAAHVAVLDGEGNIKLVNRAWRDFAEQNGASGMLNCGPGISYLEVCRIGAMLDKSAHHVLEGLSSVLNGSQASFVCEYPCDAPNEPRWFQLHAARMAAGGVLVTHTRLDAGPQLG